MSKPVVLTFVSLLFAACGGGGSSSAAVQGLQAPQQVSIVEASGGSASTVRLAPDLLPVEGSDYVTDPTRFWIEDSSMQPLNTVNMILDSLQQTRYWEQTNEGPYTALVSEDESGGGERGNNATSYAKWTVDSTRASNSAPQIVRFWLEQNDTMGDPTPSIIYGRLTVTEEPSDAQPLGAFTLFFKNLGVGLPASSTDTAFEGYLRTVPRTDGQSELEFFMSHGDVDGTVALNEYAMRDRVHVIGDPSSDAGRAYTETVFKLNNGSIVTEAGEWQIQFNADYLARRDQGSTLAVLDRNDFVTRVYRYGVYDATSEDRVEQQGGFPIETENGDNGWAGFHGIWLPEGVTLNSGDTVLRRSFRDNSTTPYTAFVANGRLERRTRSALTLLDIIDEPLEWFDPNNGEDLRIVWTGQDLVKIAVRSNGSWSAISPPVSVASSFSTGDWISTWSQARGQVEWSWPASPQNSTPAYVWQVATVTADSPEMANGDLTLHGYFSMLRANITSNQANFQNSESPYLPDATGVSTGNTVYTFDDSTLLLQIGADPVTLANGVTVTQGPGMFGLNCGPLFAEPLTSFADIDQVETTYQWYTGSNEWNQLRTLQDGAGDFVDFDPPLRLSYTHSEVSSPYDGRTFFLEWDGSNLGGVPFEEDPATNTYYPVFNIPTGATVVSGQTSYKVKQLEGEQTMVEVGDPATVYAAQGFDLDGTPITAPTADPYEDPAIGAKPTVTSAPLYVGGVQQSDG